jgi:hypothetical protein
MLTATIIRVMISVISMMMEAQSASETSGNFDETMRRQRSRRQSSSGHNEAVREMFGSAVSKKIQISRTTLNVQKKMWK